MQSAPKSDKSLGIPHLNEKFRDVRKKAKEDEVTRHKKAKKDKEAKLPKYKIGEEVVLTGGGYSSNRHYHLVEIIDFEEDRYDRFVYYGILKKTTEHERLGRIGRLVKFEGHGFWSRDFSPANVENKGIKWLIFEKVK